MESPSLASDVRLSFVWRATGVLLACIWRLSGVHFGCVLRRSASVYHRRVARYRDALLRFIRNTESASGQEFSRLSMSVSRVVSHGFPTLLLAFFIMLTGRSDDRRPRLVLCHSLSRSTLAILPVGDITSADVNISLHDFINIM